MATATATTTAVTVPASIHSHHVPVPELDLSSLYLHTSVVDRFNETFPGLKTSAAFFTFLRANLALDQDMTSPNTPHLFDAPNLPAQLAFHTSFPSAPSSSVPSRASSIRAPSTRAPSEVDGPAGLPHLAITPISSPPTKAAALRLIAASINEDRASATRRLARHPIGLIILSSILAAVCHFVPERDVGTLLVLCSGIIMSYLSIAHYLTAGYEAAAACITPSFLLRCAATGEEDLVLGAMWGTALIGTLALRLEPNPPLSPASGASTVGHRRHKSRASIGSLKSLQRRGGRGVIRAWTIAAKYRGQDVGGDLLREAVRMVREKMGKDAEVGFAKEHANSTRVLPEWLDAEIRRRETRAGLALRDVLKEWEGRGRRR